MVESSLLKRLYSFSHLTSKENITLRELFMKLLTAKKVGAYLVTVNLTHLKASHYR